MPESINANKANGVPASLTVPVIGEPIDPNDVKTPYQKLLDGLADVDDRVKNISADPTQALPTTNGPRSLLAWVNALTRRVKEILGTTNWYDAAPASLKTLNDRVTTLEGAGNFVVEGLHLVGTNGEPGFGAGWSSRTVNGYLPVGFYKDPLGRVWLQGAAGGAVGGTIFTLPAGYRPSGIVRLVAYGDGGTPVEVDINTTGNVVVLYNNANETLVTLDGLSFRV